MKVIKKFGNNAALCVDGRNRELIALGLGIGFPKCPYEITDMSKIDKTFYGIDAKFMNMLTELDPSIFELCADILEVATAMLNVTLNPNAVVILADHISFAIDRLKKGMTFSFPLSNELKDLYPNEVKIAKYAVHLLHKKKAILLPENEVYGIAMNIINAEEKPSENADYRMAESMIDDIIQIIQNTMHTKIKQDTFNYSRFVSHMQYLWKRKDANEQKKDENQRMFLTMQKEYPQTYACVCEIKAYLMEAYRWLLHDDEALYLILHVNRLCSREGCNN